MTQKRLIEWFHMHLYRGEEGEENTHIDTCVRVHPIQNEPARVKDVTVK